MAIIYSRGPQPLVVVRGLWNWAAQQEASGKQAKLHLPLPIAPFGSHYCLNHPPTPPVHGKLVFHVTSP